MTVLKGPASLKPFSPMSKAPGGQMGTFSMAPTEDVLWSAGGRQADDWSRSLPAWGHPGHLYLPVLPAEAFPWPK